MQHVMKQMVVIASLLLLNACRHAPPDYIWVDDLMPTRITPVGEYTIGYGDAISVRVYNQDNMSARVRVRNDGKVSLPFLNDVEAAGKSPTQLAQDIQTRLREYIVNPMVTVVLEETRPLSISVLGEVIKPGVYPLESGAGVLQAIASAGGATDFARRDRVFVLRKMPEPMRIRFTYEALVSGQGKAAGFDLRPGDVVVVE
jgi:polysaccharide biosynthesis/export protein